MKKPKIKPDVGIMSKTKKAKKTKKNKKSKPSSSKKKTKKITIINKKDDPFKIAKRKGDITPGFHPG